MVATAYVLITVGHGMARKVYDKLSKIPSITHVNAVTGPYDMILTIQGSDFNTIGNLIINKIHSIEGIDRTITCNVIEFEQ